MHKPLKGSFTDIINAVADGRGVKLQARNASPPKERMVRSSKPPKPPKPEKR